MDIRPGNMQQCLTCGHIYQ